MYAAGVLLVGGAGWNTRPGAPGAVAQLASLASPAVLLLAVGVVGFWRAEALRRRQMMGLLLLALVGYAAIAATAALSGRTAWAMRLGGIDRATAIASVAMLPRYHYVSTMGLAMVVALAVDTIVRRAMPVPGVVRAACLVAVGALAWRVAWWDHATVQRLVTHDVLTREARRLDADIRAAPDPVVLRNAPVGGGFVALHEEAFPGRAALYVVLHRGAAAHGKAVRFVEDNPHLLATALAQRGTPISRLLVAPASGGAMDAPESLR